MKYLLILLLSCCAFTACNKEETFLFDNSITMHDIRMLQLRSDHQTMFPGSKSKMNLRAVVYGIRELNLYSKETIGDSVVFRDYVVYDTFVIPNDLIQKDWIKIYDDQNNLLENNVFTTTDMNPRTVTFKATLGELESRELPIQIREVVEPTYEPIVYPVIFHVLIPPSSAGLPPTVTTADLQKKLDRVNDIFNHRVTTDPNGGDARITFELAKYNPNGAPLIEPGKNQVNLIKALPDKLSHEEYIWNNMVWDQKKYLNVWIVSISKLSGSIDNVTTYSAKSPSVQMDGTEPIAGLKITAVDDTWKPKEIYDVGILVPYTQFFNPAANGSDLFEFGTALASYLGLFSTQVTDLGTNMVDGDNDYCPDTQYYLGGATTMYKNNEWDKVVDRPVFYFTSFNIMDAYSWKNSISADQAVRLRQVTERCPSRWSYKSKWAFTGKN